MGNIMNSNDLLDAVKAKLNLPSDYALARNVLKVDLTSLRDMRRRGLSDERALQVATLLDLNPGWVLMQVHADRAKDPEIKRLWKVVADSIPSKISAVFAAALAALVLSGLPTPANAAGAFNPEYTLCAIRRRLGRLRARLGAFLTPTRYLGIPLIAVLAACGAAASSEDEGSTSNQNWRGGLVGVWEPAGEPIGKIILHQGHAPFSAPEYAPADLRPVAASFAAAGYVVYGMEMPPPPHDGRPLIEFTAHVSALLDAIGPAYMVGLSGGGWTTTVVTAADPRIVRGYSVAGDSPIDVWGAHLPNFGRDAEQHLVDYRALYAMAGDRLMHVYNWVDPCCWDRIAGEIGYPYVTDYSASDHAITPWAVDFIVSDIAAHSSQTVQDAVQ